MKSGPGAPTGGGGQAPSHFTNAPVSKFLIISSVVVYLIGVIWKGKFRGQKQKWFIARFLGQDSEINLNTKHPEFIKWKWLEPEKLPDVIVDFKKNLYLKLLKEINLVIG